MISGSPWNSKCHCTAQMRWDYERILSELSVPTPEAGWLRWLFFAPIPNILTTHVPEAGAFVWSHAQTHQNHHNVPSSVTTLSTFAHYVTYKFCSTSSATRVTLLSPPSIVRIVPHMDIPPNTDQWMTGRWQDKVLSRMFFFPFWHGNVNANNKNSSWVISVIFEETKGVGLLVQFRGKCSVLSMKHIATTLNDKIKYCLAITLVCNTLSIREGAPATPTIIGVGRKGAGSDRRRASCKII